MNKKKNYNKILCERGHGRHTILKGRRNQKIDEDSPDRQGMREHLEWWDSNFRDHIMPLERMIRSMVGKKETYVRSFVCKHAGKGFQRNHVLEHYKWLVRGYETEDGMINTHYGQYHHGQSRWGILSWGNYFYVDKNGFLREYRSKNKKKSYPDNHKKKAPRKLNDQEGREQFLDLINQIKKAS